MRLLFLALVAACLSASAQTLNCSDSGGQHANYDAASHSWLCGTTSSGGGGGLTGASYITNAAGSTAIQSAVAAFTSTRGIVFVSPNTPLTEGLPIRITNIAGPQAGEGSAYAFPSNVTACDYRYGIVCQNANAGGPYGGGNYLSWQRYDLISSAQNPLTSLNYLGRSNAVFTHTALAGGVNENTAANPNKSFYYNVAQHMYGFTRGQKIGSWNVVGCPGVGDCAGVYAIVHSHGTFQGNSDEGTEAINGQAWQDSTQPAGKISAISGQNVTLVGPAGSGNPNAGNEIGEGHFFVDTSAVATGNITSMVTGASNTPFFGTILRFNVSNVLTASTIDTSFTGLVTAGNTSTVTVASAAGLSVGTVVKLSNHQHIENVTLTAVSGTSISFISRYTYDSNGYMTNAAMDIACPDADTASSTDFNGYLITSQIDSNYPKPFCIPIVRNGTNYIDAWWVSPNSGYQGYHGRWNNSTRAAYHAYKALEVISVKDATLDQLSNTIKLEIPIGTRFAVNDNFIVADYFSVLFVGSYFSAQQLFPSTSGAQPAPFVFQVNGVWDNRDTLVSVRNNTPPTLYNSQGLARPNGIVMSGTSNFLKLFPSDCTSTSFCAPQYIINDEGTGNQPIMFKISSASSLGVFQANGGGNGGAGTWEWTNYNNSERAWIDMLHPRFGSDLHTPTSSSEACVAGTFWADATYLYVCTATNTIKRTAALTGGF